MKRNDKLKVIGKNYYLFIRDFFTDLLDDKLGHYASSLSWSTLFSLIPLMVVLMALFTSMPLFHGVYSKIELLIFSNLMPSDSKVIMTYINSFVISTDKLGRVGIIYVIVALIMFFKNYDYIVNDIFGLPCRKFDKAIKLYVLILFLIPVVLGMSFYISTFIQSYLDRNSITAMIHLFTFLPFVIAWITFYLAYQLSANTRVDFKAALISSFIASLVWYLSKMAFVFYATHNNTYISI